MSRLHVERLESPPTPTSPQGCVRDRTPLDPSCSVHALRSVGTHLLDARILPAHPSGSPAFVQARLGQHVAQADHHHRQLEKRRVSNTNTLCSTAPSSSYTGPRGKRTLGSCTRSGPSISVQVPSPWSTVTPLGGPVSIRTLSAPAALTDSAEPVETRRRGRATRGSHRRDRARPRTGHPPSEYPLPRSRSRPQSRGSVASDPRRAN